MGEVAGQGNEWYSSGTRDTINSFNKKYGKTRGTKEAKDVGQGL